MGAATLAAMRRLSIARSLRVALVGLTLVLAVIAALGVSSLYSARQKYENTLAQSASLSTAAANLAADGIAEEEVLRDARGPGAQRARTEVESDYASAAALATSLARPDPPSAALIAAQISAQSRARAELVTGNLGQATAVSGPLAQARALAVRVQQRQAARQSAARAKARSKTRRAVILVSVAGVLALLAALALITLLVSRMRRPLDELVQATGALAAGKLSERVTPAGPRELKDLGDAFNAMGEDLSRAQERIESERSRLAVTIESLGDALIVTEPDSTQIAAVNPRASELLPALVAAGRIDVAGSPLPPLDQALDGETVVEHDGRTLSIVAAALGSAADGTVWTVRDMSERARLERAKSEFVATASHELRSPLTSIKGFVELLDRSPENMSSRQREFVEIILRSTDRLVDLVNDLLDVARIEADHVEISRRPIDVGEAVREVAELMGPRIEDKHQQLGVYVAPALPLALADSGRVRQIVANLLTNAHLYTPEHGRIHIGVEPDRAWVQIVVEDSGIGMNPEESSRVFERFYRARSAGGDGRLGAHSSTGTGLGLSIVKSLVDLHDGVVEVDSEPGRGTAFRVLLPAAVPGPESSRSLEAIRGRHVLVVDDEHDIAELIAGQLAPLNVEATIANSGEEALALLRAQHFDAVTLDILMPEMDGFAVLREIRSDPELRRIPILFVSVFSGRQELAGEWIVSKPIDADELRDVLGAAISAGRSRVLVVGREEVQETLEPALDDFGIEHDWVVSGAAAARVCGERRYEVALVDVGIRSPQAVLQALDLRGRRLRRAVIMFSDGVTDVPPGIGRLGMEVVPVDQAAAALLAALRGERDA
jgi:signal transduction histidine kinase/DNA-binding response OmpR family regulator/HAMP domain-containing protein